jgi:hypothetical protein
LTDYTVESTPETVRSGFLDPKAAPVASVASGDTVRYPHTWTHWGNEAVYGMTFADREPLRHRVHSTGAEDHRLGLELLPAWCRRAAC